MSKSTSILVVIIVSILFGAFAYLMSQSIIIAAFIAAIYIIALSIFPIGWIGYYQNKNRKRKECYQFVFSFIVSLSLTGSLEKAYEGSVNEFGKEGKELLSSLEELPIRDRIFYLDGYFESESYSMFLSLYTLYETQGGDFLHISKELLDEITRVEETGNINEKEGARNVFSFISMWVLTIVIMGLLRFGLANFYDNGLAGSYMYLGSIVLFFAFMLFSMLLYCYIFTGKPPIKKLLKGRKK